MKWKLPSISINRRSCLLLSACLLLVSAVIQAQPPEPLVAGSFSSASAGDALPQDWQPLTFSRIKRHTAYSLVEDDDIVVVKAVSDHAASGLTRRVSIDPAEYPVIEWHWKIDNILRKGDVSHKAGDDYPARIYITFAIDPDRAGYLDKVEYQAARLIHGEDVPYRAISYIWGSNSPAGTMIANAYTSHAMMFVIEGGSDRLGQWVIEKRNVYEDYRRAFGEEPAMITGVAIMTDTDNTLESAVAWYGDIAFRRDELRP